MSCAFLPCNGFPKLLVRNSRGTSFQSIKKIVKYNYEKFILEPEHIDEIITSSSSQVTSDEKRMILI